MGRILDSPQFSGTIQFLTGTFTASAGTTVDLSASTLKLPANCLTAAMLPLMTGDTGQGAGGASGAVPAPPLGSAAGGMFLSAGGQWAVPAAGLPAGTALVLSPMTTAGDMIVGGPNGSATRLPAPAAGTAGTQTLQWTAAGGIAWGVAAAGGGGGIADAPSNGVLYGRENGGWVEVPAGGGGTLVGLSDVDETTAPTNGQALVYSAAESKWKPGTVAAGGGGGSSSPQIVQSVFGRGGGGFNITLPNPPQAGNTLLFFGYGSAQNTNFPAGVVFIAGGVQNVNSSQATWVGMRVAAAGEAATNWNFGCGDWFNGAILEVSGIGGMTCSNFNWGGINSTDIGCYCGLLAATTLKIGVLEWDNAVDPTMYNLPPGVVLQNNSTTASGGGNHCAVFWAWVGPGYMTSFTIPNVSRPTYLGVEISGLT